MEMIIIIMLTIIGIIITALIIYSTTLVLKQIDSVQESLYLQKEEVDNIRKDLDVINNDILQNMKSINNLMDLECESKTCILTLGRYIITINETINTITKDVGVIK